MTDQFTMTIDPTAAADPMFWTEAKELAEYHLYGYTTAQQDGDTLVPLQRVRSHLYTITQYLDRFARDRTHAELYQILRFEGFKSEIRKIEHYYTRTEAA